MPRLTMLAPLHARLDMVHVWTTDEDPPRPNHIQLTIDDNTTINLSHHSRGRVLWSAHEATVTVLTFDSTEPLSGIAYWEGPDGRQATDLHGHVLPDADGVVIAETTQGTVRAWQSGVSWTPRPVT